MASASEQAGEATLSDAERQRVLTLALDAAEGLPADSSDLGAPGSLARILYETWVRVYEQTISQELEAAGQAPTEPVTLGNEAVLESLRERSRQTAAQVEKTWARDLESFVRRLPKDTAPEEAPRLVARWNLERSMWKTAQIALTETATAQGAAQKDFLQRSRPAQGTALFGFSLQCALCQQIAAGNPYALDDPAIGDIPHPGCLDMWRISYQHVTDPWDGS